MAFGLFSSSLLVILSLQSTMIVRQKMDFSIMLLFIYFNIAVALKILSIKQKLIQRTIVTIKDSSAWIIQKKQKCDMCVFYLHFVFSSIFNFWLWYVDIRPKLGLSLVSKTLEDDMSIQEQDSITRLHPDINSNVFIYVLIQQLHMYIICCL